MVFKDRKVKNAKIEEVKREGESVQLRDENFKVQLEKVHSYLYHEEVNHMKFPQDQPEHLGR